MPGQILIFIINKKKNLALFFTETELLLFYLPAKRNLVNE